MICYVNSKDRTEIKRIIAQQKEETSVLFANSIEELKEFLGSNECSPVVLSIGKAGQRWKQVLEVIKDNPKSTFYFTEKYTSMSFGEIGLRMEENSNKPMAPIKFILSSIL